MNHRVQGDAHQNTIQSNIQFTLLVIVLAPTMGIDFFIMVKGSYNKKDTTFEKTGSRGMW